MSSGPVTSTHVSESAVIAADTALVWQKIKTLDFSWWKLVKSSIGTSGAPLAIGSQYSVTFVDGHTWAIELREISDISRSVTFEVSSTRFYLEGGLVQLAPS